MNKVWLAAEDGETVAEARNGSVSIPVEGARLWAVEAVTFNVSVAQVGVHGSAVHRYQEATTQAQRVLDDGNGSLGQKIDAAIDALRARLAAEGG